LTGSYLDPSSRMAGEFAKNYAAFIPMNIYTPQDSTQLVSLANVRPSFRTEKVTYIPHVKIVLLETWSFSINHTPRTSILGTNSARLYPS
jgi:hypothetical protein